MSALQSFDNPTSVVAARIQHIRELETPACHSTTPGTACHKLTLNRKLMDMPSRMHASGPHTADACSGPIAYHTLSGMRVLPFQVAGGKQR